MSTGHRCHYCGLWIGEGADSVHPECHDAAYYAAALTKVRAMPVLPPIGSDVRGRHMQRAVRRVGLERWLDVLMAESRT
jgi:hypothetical protein